jgi:light-regulated signal transduction histidine kinase (bacteriophytochrome)
MKDLLTADGTRALHNEEKEKLVAQLIQANRELAFQNEEKEKRAAELLIANKELVFQNQEKEKRALELIIANRELAFQNNEKGKRAAELVIANKELAFQNNEKEKRAAELIIANNELVFQNQEKEKRAAELAIVNQELLTFTYISNHDMQEPLRKIQVFISRILGSETGTLSETGQNHLRRIQVAAERMQEFIKDLLLYHYANNAEYKFEKIELGLIINVVKKDLERIIEDKNAIIEFNDVCYVDTMFVSFRQLLYNIIHNALKFSNPDVPPHIVIKATIASGSDLKIAGISAGKQYCHIAITDNGIGFEPEFNERIFDVFHRRHNKEEYPGTGIGLAIARKIVMHHKGVITATSSPGRGTTIDVYIPG